MLDLAHSFMQLLGDPNADQTFQSTATLLNNYESPTARLIGAMLDASDRGKKHPEAVVPETLAIIDRWDARDLPWLRYPGNGLTDQQKRRICDQIHADTGRGERGERLL